MKKKILLYGIGTYKNKGVEAIIQSTTNQIDLKKYEIVAATHDYNYNKNYYTNKIKNYIKHYKKSDELNTEEKALEEKYKSMPFDYNNFELLYQNDVIKELEESDICISVGGDNYCYDHCTWLYAIDHKAKELNKKTILWGASLFEEIESEELINDLNQFDILVLRETLSYNAVKKYISNDKLMLLPDPAFSLKPKTVKLNGWYKKNREYIILNFSPLTIENTKSTNLKYQGVINLIDYILNETKYSICLLPHVTTEDCNDLTILTKLKNKYKNEDRIYLEKEKYNCNELKYIISKSKIVVAARTHASIAAYSSCVPTLVIGYSVKSRGIAKDLFGSIDEYVIDSKKIRQDTLIEKFKYIEENKTKIKETLEKEMPSIIEKSSNIFEKLEEKIELLEKKTICQKVKCIGCGLCTKQCPKNAITMEKNKERFIYPNIDLEKCINCNLCRKNCPININVSREKYEKKYFAAKNKNVDEREKSTSGGIFSVFAKKILEEKGIVYGCEMTNNKAQHIRITKKSELEKIRGSKYIQSNISNVFELIKKDLDSKKKVLFSGTPCQIGVIKSIFKDNENLFTISVICHGVLNEKLFDGYLTGNSSKITNWNFRCKENGWTKSSVLYYENKIKRVKKFMDDPIMYLYLKNVLLRESCYNCKYKGENNLADIILGDHWGIEITNNSFYDELGVSAVIINTEKGQEEFNKIKNNIEYTDSTYENIIKYNPALIESSNRPYFRDKLSNKISDDVYTSIINIYKDYKISANEQENETILKENEQLRLENIELVNYIDNIHNSKRWKLIDKIGNVFNKIRRR